MLATAGEQSSRKDASGTSTGKRTKLDILADAAKPASPKPKSSSEQKKIAESIAKELSRWEKVVFSFDMDRNAGRSASGSGQRGDEEDNSNPRRQAQASSRSSSSSGAYPNQPHPFPNHPGSQNAAFPSFQQAPHLSGQQEQYHHQIGAPGLGGLDPYVLQQLAAISAMSGAPPQGSHQVQDPFSSLRQMQNALHQGNHGPSDAYSGLPRGFPQAGPSGSLHTPSSHIPLPQGIPNQALLNSPAGLQWLAHVQSMQQPQQPQQTAHPPPLLHGYGGHDQRQGQRQQQIAPLTFPGSAYPQQTQSSGAGPSRARGSIAGSSSGGSSRAASASSPSPVSPAAALSRGQGDMDEAAIAEDKRRRNTAASGTPLHLL